MGGYKLRSLGCNFAWETQKSLRNSGDVIFFSNFVAEMYTWTNGIQMEK